MKCETIFPIIMTPKDSYGNNATLHETEIVFESRKVKMSYYILQDSLGDFIGLDFANLLSCVIEHAQNSSQWLFITLPKSPLSYM